MAGDGAMAARDQVLAEIRSCSGFCLVTHEHPDGDALGSLVAMHRILTALGKDSVMLMAADEFPLPYEYRFFDLAGLSTVPPTDLPSRTIIYLDCGNIDRNPLGIVKGEDVHILNVDHHHDNTRFGTVNLVDPEAACTTEIVWDLMRRLGVEADQEIAEALYVGLVTDTGRFMYENTGPRAHVMAAELIEAGVDTHAIYRRLYEDMPYAKLELLGRALARVERHDGGSLTVARVTREDFEAVGAEDSYTEGIIDHLRSVEQTKVAALSREVEAVGSNGGGGVRKKVSLRSTDGEVDVSAIARAGGGGGHRQAAGFTTELGDDELVAFLREQIAAQLGEASAGGLVSRQQLA
jgi:bifunctional oligoribonuclease and PAP phosphatase NrnA